MSKVFDVIIVGGGPAGATAGLVLARKGLDVLILEKKNFPRFKLCGGMLTRKALELGQSILPGFLSAMESRGIIEKKIDTYSIKTQDSLLYQGNARHPFILVNRAKYDYLWMEQALDAGAKVFIDRVVRVDMQNSSIITSAGEIYQGKFIIGADGSGSRIRKALAQKNIVQPPRSENSAMALETFVKREAGTFMDYPELFLGLVRDGYAWSFPGSRFQVVGICSSRTKNGRELKRRLMEMLASQGVANPEEYKIQAHVLPYGDYEKKPGFKNVLLIGDAAGLAEPLLGEGIYYAHVSGSLSAGAVLKCMNKTDQSCEIYARSLTRVISSMSKRLLFRKMTLGMPPALAELSFRFLLPLIAPALEDRIHGKHFKLVS
jgi:geranylgeranyl reductase family protein